MPASIREVKEGKKTGLARGRIWTVIQPQQRPQGSSKALRLVPSEGKETGPFKSLNPLVIRHYITVEVIPLFALGQLITVSTIAPLGRNVGTLVGEIHYSTDY